MHISVDGSAEPCPFSPFADVNLKNISLKEALGSRFLTLLSNRGMLHGEHSGGCLLFEKQNEVKELLNKN